MNKVCKSCNQDKSVTEFYTNNKNNDGYDTQCKECKRNKRKSAYKTKNCSSNDQNCSGKDLNCSGNQSNSSQNHTMTLKSGKVITYKKGYDIKDDEENEVLTPVKQENIARTSPNCSGNSENCSNCSGDTNIYPIKTILGTVINGPGHFKEPLYVKLKGLNFHDLSINTQEALQYMRYVSELKSCPWLEKVGNYVLKDGNYYMKNDAFSLVIYSEEKFRKGKLYT